MNGLRQVATALFALTSAHAAAAPSDYFHAGSLSDQRHTSHVWLAQATGKSAEIKQMQMTLNALGFDVGEADGIMGSRTRSVLLGFQYMYGIPETGMLDDATRRALQRAQEGAMERHTPSEAIEAPRSVQAYHHNLLEGEIEDVQTWLNAAGYDAGEPTGEVNDQTRQALAAFQKDRGLPVSGLVGPETWDALEANSAPPASNDGRIEF